MYSTDYLIGLSQSQLYSIVKELNLENECLKNDLIKCDLLLKSYQKYFVVCDEINETIASKFGSNKQMIELKAEINVFKSLRQNSCSVSLNKLSDKCLKETNVRKILGSIQPIVRKTQETRDGSKGKYKCNFKGCSTVLASVSSLRAHRNKHTDRFLCGINGCEYRAGKPSNLAEHKMRIHLNNKLIDYSKANTNNQIKKYECGLNGCGFRTQFMYRLKTHKICVHSNVRPFECPINECNKWFKTREHVVSHLKRGHKYSSDQINCMTIKGRHPLMNSKPSQSNDSNRKYICDVEDCGHRSLTKAHLKAHKINKHSDEKPFECLIDDCDIRCKNSFNIRDHMKRVHKMTANQINTQLNSKGIMIKNNGFGKYVCPHKDCKRRFKERSSFRRHLSGVHKMTTNQINSVVEWKGPSTKHKVLGKYICPQEECKRRFKMGFNLRRHMRGVHKTSEKQINKIVKQISKQLTDNNKRVKTLKPEEGVQQINKLLFEDIPQLDDDLFNSPLDSSDNKFEGEDLLIYNKTIDHNLSEIKCETEEQTYDSNEERVPKNKYICGYIGCGKLMNTRLALKVHEEEHRIFQCDVKGCQFRGSSSEVLEIHKNRHSNQGLSLCLVCNKKFYSRELLADHQKAVHQIIGSKSDETLEQQMDDNSNQSLDEQIEGVLDQTNEVCIEETAIEVNPSDKQMERQLLVNTSSNSSNNSFKSCINSE